MIPKELLNKEVQEFIKAYRGSIPKLALKGNPFPAIPFPLLLQQIEGFHKAEKKLPTWAKHDNIVYPPKLNIEQTSSETTAAYKALLVNGETLADLTGGFGVDTYYFSKSFKKIHHVEQNEVLSGIAHHNFTQFGIHHIQCINGNGLEYIKNQSFDVIYIDPSRRHDAKGKVFFLKDCEPNIVEQLDFMLSKCKSLLLKTSPMLDISVGISELKNISEIHVVAVDNDVKEILWKIQDNLSKAITIKTINFKGDAMQSFDFTYQGNALATFSIPKTFLYEPNAAILKAGAFNEISAFYGTDKLGVHSHLYTADTLIDFPGRRFKVVDVLPYNKQSMKLLQGQAANITTRNFPEQVTQIRKKWKIRDGGSNYLFFTTLESGERIVINTLKVDEKSL